GHGTDLLTVLLHLQDHVNVLLTAAADAQKRHPDALHGPVDARGADGGKGERPGDGSRGVQEFAARDRVVCVWVRHGGSLVGWSDDVLRIAVGAVNCHHFATLICFSDFTRICGFSRYSVTFPVTVIFLSPKCFFGSVMPASFRSFSSAFMSSTTGKFFSLR